MELGFRFISDSDKRKMALVRADELRNEQNAFIITMFQLALTSAQIINSKLKMLNGRIYF